MLQGGVLRAETQQILRLSCCASPSACTGACGPHAVRHTGREHDTRHERKTLSGWSAASGDRQRALLSRPSQSQWVISELLTLLDATYSARQITRIYGVVDTDCIHKAKAVEQWVASHPRFELLWLPTYCPRANPIERVFGDVHDQCTRNHKWKHLRDLVQDVERHMEEHGPWQYRLSQLYDAPEVAAVVENIAAEKHAKMAA